jgi:dihydrofolate synthase/folylpolyglutamate synthase
MDLPFSDPLAGRLFPPLATGVEWGLGRMRRALSALGDPHLAYETVHVGGTNGKGSVTATVGSVLRADGRRVAWYTSPHLCSFRERMLVDGAPLSEEAMEAYAADIRDVVSAEALTFFEAVTLLAMHAFAREKVEVAVMEVGLGGRLDATNVVEPRVTAVTNVAMDHAEYLGDTIELIAREKAGIMKRGIPFVTAEESTDVLALFRALASEAGAPMTVVDPGMVRDIEVSPDHTSLTLESAGWGELRLRTPLVGRHQAANAAVAVAVLERLGDDLVPARASVLDGVASVVHHGRDEITRLDGRTWLFDVAHNVAGIQSLVDTIDRLELPRPLVALLGVQGDKDWRVMLPALLSRTDVAILTTPPSVPPERRWDPAAAADHVEGLTVVRVEPDFVRAVRMAEERAGEGTVVVTGSVHTVGSAMKMLGLDPLRR